MILAYHRIAVSRVDPFGLCLPPATFRRQMEMLCETRLPISLRRLADFVREGDVPPEAVAVTFDDGYLDNLTVASPILLELAIPATFFVTTAGLAQPSEYWWDTLGSLLEPGSMAVRTLDLPPMGVQFALDSPSERKRAVHSLQQLMRSLTLGQREAVLDCLLNQVPHAAGISGARSLLLSELQDLAARPGHDIGVHTIDHLSLPAQPSEVKRQQLLGCKGHLESIIPCVTPAISYPFGDVDTETVEIARASGFDIGVTTIDPSLNAWRDLLLLPRTLVNATTFEPA